MRRRALLLTSIVLLLPLTARAEEGADAVLAATEAALAKLPAPSAEHAFTFEGDAVMNGAPFGNVTFKAEPTGEGTGWSVSDMFSFGGGAYVRTSTALLDRRLQPLSGRVEGKEPGTDGFEVTWTHTDTGFTAKHTATKAGETTSAETKLEQTGTMTTTMCSLWLFARLTRVQPGSFAVLVFDADPGEGDASFEQAAWTQGEKGTWDDREVLVLKGAKGDSQIEAAFDPETGALLGARMRNEAKGHDLVIRPAAEAPAEPADDIYARPARNAKEAALQAGLAFATKDLALAERVIHWPSLHAQAKAGYAGEEPFPDVETFKAATMKNLESSLTERPREMIEGALTMVQDQLQEESLEGGRTKVTFPPLFGGLEMVVAPFEDVWYVVQLPGAPK